MYINYKTCHKCLLGWIATVGKTFIYSHDITESKNIFIHKFASCYLELQ